MKCPNDTANLINPIAPREYVACITWYNRSCFLLLCMMLAMGSYTGYQCWQLLLLKQEQGALIPVPVQEHGNVDVLKKQLVSLQKNKELLAALVVKKSLFNQDFKRLLSVIPDDICLSYFEYAHEKFIEISGQGRSLSVITQFLQKMQQIPAVAALEVTKLQPFVDSDKKEYINFMMH